MARPPMAHAMSSNVRSFGYDYESMELWIAFRNTPGFYVYENVPAIVHRGLEVAESKGAFLHENVINHYSSYQVDA